MKNKKIIIICVALIAVIAVSVILIVRFGRLRATTMKINSVTGEVILTSEDGSAEDVWEGRRLFDGNFLETKENGRTTVLLDKDRFIYLLELSQAKVFKSGKDLRMVINEGSTFFYIADKLSDDESLKVETTTMSIGIRGTSGYIDTDISGNSVLYLTSGNVDVDVFITAEKYELNAGQKMTVKQSDDGTWTVVIEDIAKLPGEAIEIIEADESLLEEVVNSMDYYSVSDISDSEIDDFAPEGIPIDEEHFPDEAFRYLLQHQEEIRWFDENGDGYYSDSEIQNIKRLSINSDSEIRSLKGIEYFSALELLLVHDCPNITELDVSQNTELTSICVSEMSGLKELDLSNNKKLFDRINSGYTFKEYSYNDPYNINCDYPCNIYWQNEEDAEGIFTNYLLVYREGMNLIIGDNVIDPSYYQDTINGVIEKYR